MQTYKRMFVATLFLAGLSRCLFAQHQFAPPTRDAQVIEILNRTVAAAGGLQALAAIRDVTEHGEITFHWGKSPTGSVTIRMLGGSYIRMDASLAGDRHTWIVADGVGLKVEGGKKVLLPPENSLNLGHLTYPIGLALSALTDTSTDISFGGIEKRDNRSVYRLQLRGLLGLSSKMGLWNPVSKDLIVDALTFDITSVEDRPFHRSPPRNKLSETRENVREKGPFPRRIDFADFRTVNGARIPFSIRTKLLGQEALTIHLDEVVVNTHMTPEAFQLSD